MINLSLIFSAAILTFLVIIDIYALKYPFEARLFPWVIGIPATILMTIVMLKESYQMRQGKREGTFAKKSEHKVSSPRDYALIIAWMAAFLIFIYVLGFWGGIPFFLFLYLKTHGLGWLLSLGTALGLFIFIYCVFSLGMEMRLYPGLIRSF